jgi:hypothetical protein
MNGFPYCSFCSENVADIKTEAASLPSNDAITPSTLGSHSSSTVVCAICRTYDEVLVQYVRSLLD